MLAQKMSNKKILPFRYLILKTDWDLYLSLKIKIYIHPNMLKPSTVYQVQTLQTDDRH